MMATTMSPRRHRGSVVFPLLLILIGVGFLLQNFGLLRPGFWASLAQLWPLLLIVFGVELLVGRSVGRLAQLAIVAIVLILGVGLMGSIELGRALVAGPPATTILEQPLEGANRASVRLNFGAGRFNLGALDRGAPQLAAATLDGPPGAGLDRRYRVRDGAGDFALDLRGDNLRWMPFPFPRLDRPPLDLTVRLSPDVPLTLDARLGVSDARLDLSALRLTRLDLETGASTTWLRLPEAAGQTSGRIRSGAATIEIEIPTGVAAQIDYQGGISNVDVAESRFPLVGEGSGAPRRPPPPPAGGAPAPPPPPAPPGFLAGSRLYRSPDYDTAANKVDLLVETGVSSVTIR